MSNVGGLPLVTIQTLAYNVENYIIECAESIINQTFTDFEWLVLDNGSTDKTGDILEEYAKKDNRIKLFKNEKNSYIYNVPFHKGFIEHYETLKSEYWCTLDSDDYIHPDFLRELYTAAKLHNADIAVGGTELFKETDPQQRSMRCPPNFYTDSISDLGDMLPQIYGCFRPMWGKLFKTSIVKKQQEHSKQNPRGVKNGWDTLFCLDCLDFSRSVVGVNKVLHYYRVRQDSHYHTQVDKNRYVDYKVIYEDSKKLLEKWNKLNSHNMCFIAGVLYYSMKDCMQFAAKAVSVPIGDRLDVIETILSDKAVYDVLVQMNLINNLFADTENIITNIITNLKEQDLVDATTHYIYRLYKSLIMINSSQPNIQNALLLYLSALCDESNLFHFGKTLLYRFFSATGRHNIQALEKAGVKNNLLASNPILLRELVNSNFNNAIYICDKNNGNPDYEVLTNELKKLTPVVDFGWIDNATALIEKTISSGNNEAIVDLLLKVLEFCPLNKKALCYKLYLLAVDGDVLTALETAETLRVFYSDDAETLAYASQAYLLAGSKDKAKEVLTRALDLCTDDTKRNEIKEDLESIK